MTRRAIKSSLSRPNGPPEPLPTRKSRGRLVPQGLMVVAVAGLIATLSQGVWGTNLGRTRPLTVRDDTVRLDLAAAPLGSECLNRSLVTTARPGVHTRPYRLEDVADDTTVDLRGATFNAFMDKTRTKQVQNNYPVVVGTNRPARPCVVGGVVVGRQSRDLTWEEIKHGAGRHDGGGNDGDGLRVESRDWAVVAGIRVANTIDGVGVGRGSGVIRDMYAEYIHDDCVEADQLSEIVLWDSLLDGCYMGISQRPGKSSPLRLAQPDPSKRVVLDHVLLRLGSELPGGHSDLFKWSEPANKLVLRDTVLMVEMESVDGTRSMDFPPGTEAHNVTLIWTGPGRYPGKVVPGVRVTSDRGVWDRLKADWLERHGCVAFDLCDPNRLVNPAPPSRSRE